MHEPKEQDWRNDLAAAFRLAEKFDYHEGICNHFSVALPSVGEGPEGERFLFNPYGLHWSEMRPERLLLTDGTRRVLEGEGEVESTAFYIHVAAHRANPRHRVVLHTHQPWATALTMVEGGRIEMAHQTAIRFWNRVAYEENFGGLALDAAEGDRLAEKAKANNGADVIFLGNHGVVTAGPTVAGAFCDLYYLERHCRQQVLAMSTGRPLKLIPAEVVEHTARQFAQECAWSDPKTFKAWVRSQLA